MSTSTFPAAPDTFQGPDVHDRGCLGFTHSQLHRLLADAVAAIESYLATGGAGISPVWPVAQGGTGQTSGPAALAALVCAPVTVTFPAANQVQASYSTGLTVTTTYNAGGTITVRFGAPIDQMLTVTITASAITVTA